jgi:hypothetical protein
MANNAYVREAFLLLGQRASWTEEWQHLAFNKAVNQFFVDTVDPDAEPVAVNPNPHGLNFAAIESGPTLSEPTAPGTAVPLPTFTKV